MALHAACDLTPPHIVRALINNDGGLLPEGFRVEPCTEAVSVGMEYLPGGNTFAAYTPPVAEGPWFHVQAADQATTSNALVDVPGFQVHLFANRRYLFDCNLWFRTAATATGILFTVTGPASPVVLDLTVETALTLSTMNVQRITAYDGGTPTPSIDAANADRLCRMTGYIQTGAASGLLKLRARSEVNASQVILRAGSRARVAVA